MNLFAFTEENKNGDLEILILKKMFAKRILEETTRAEIVEVLQSESFLNLERIALRLGKEANEEDAISLLHVIKFFDVDYLSIIQKRLRNISVTKFSLLTLFRLITGAKQYDDLLSFIEAIASDKRFLEQWRKINYLVNSFFDLIYIFGIEDEIIDYNDEETELIPVTVDDELEYNDMIIKFENFRQNKTNL